MHEAWRGEARNCLWRSGLSTQKSQIYPPVSSCSSALLQGFAPFPWDWVSGRRSNVCSEMGSDELSWCSHECLAKVLLCKSPPCFWHPKPPRCTQLPAFSQDVFQASKVPKQCAGLQVNRTWEHSYITCRVWSSAPALRNKEQKDWSTRVCLHLENTISPCLACVLHPQTMWKTWTVSWACKSSQAFQVGMLGNLYHLKGGRLRIPCPPNTPVCELGFGRKVWGSWWDPSGVQGKHRVFCRINV